MFVQIDDSTLLNIDRILVIEKKDTISSIIIESTENDSDPIKIDFPQTEQPFRAKLTNWKYIDLSEENVKEIISTKWSNHKSDFFNL